MIEAQETSRMMDAYLRNVDPDVWSQLSGSKHLKTILSAHRGHLSSK